MNPKQAVKALIDAGWSESRIAREVGTSQPTIHRIKHGSQSRGASFETCKAVIDLAEALPQTPESVALDGAPLARVG